MLHKNKNLENTSFLGNGITTDAELAQWCKKNVVGFQGVCSRTEFNEIYKKMRPGASCIINLDPEYSIGGTHWVAFKKSKVAPIAYYKDSFGAPPPQDIVDVVNSHGIGLIYGNRINQKMSEDNCGKRSAEFLQKMSIASAHGDEIETFEKLEK